MNMIFRTIRKVISLTGYNNGHKKTEQSNQKSFHLFYRRLYFSTFFKNSKNENIAHFQIIFYSAKQKDEFIVKFYKPNLCLTVAQETGLPNFRKLVIIVTRPQQTIKNPPDSSMI